VVTDLDRRNVRLGRIDAAGIADGATDGLPKYPVRIYFAFQLR
jgi:hypothetical protein